MLVPDGTPIMRNARTETVCVNPDTPELCPSCQHVTLFTFRSTVLHDEGVVQLGDQTACGSDDCTEDDAG